MLMLIHVAVGFVVGAFTPAVGRKIKAFFVKESAVVPSGAPLVSVASQVEKKL